ncbi:hypothetical protein BDR26DRAFT_986976 [Obelidium mucronatum]|nr:hypothetical protein BDR26DRAFT_986976 [Obelidium mucronatum]
MYMNRDQVAANRNRALALRAQVLAHMNASKNGVNTVGQGQSSVPPAGGSTTLAIPKLIAAAREGGVSIVGRASQRMMEPSSSVANSADRLYDSVKGATHLMEFDEEDDSDTQDDVENPFSDDEFGTRCLAVARQYQENIIVTSQTLRDNQVKLGFLCSYMCLVSEEYDWASLETTNPRKRAYREMCGKAFKFTGLKITTEAKFRQTVIVGITVAQTRWFSDTYLNGCTARKVDPSDFCLLLLEAFEEFIPKPSVHGIADVSVVVKNACGLDNATGKSLYKTIENHKKEPSPAPLAKDPQPNAQEVQSPPPASGHDSPPSSPSTPTSVREATSSPPPKRTRGGIHKAANKEPRVTKARKRRHSSPAPHSKSTVSGRKPRGQNIPKSSNPEQLIAEHGSFIEQAFGATFEKGSDDEDLVDVSTTANPVYVTSERSRGAANFLQYGNLTMTEFLKRITAAGYAKQIGQIFADAFSACPAAPLSKELVSDLSDNAEEPSDRESDLVQGGEDVAAAPGRGSAISGVDSPGSVGVGGNESDATKDTEMSEANEGSSLHESEMDVQEFLTYRGGTPRLPSTAPQHSTPEDCNPKIHWIFTMAKDADVEILVGSEWQLGTLRTQNFTAGGKLESVAIWFYRGSESFVKTIDVKDPRQLVQLRKPIEDQ